MRTKPTKPGGPRRPRGKVSPGAPGVPGAPGTPRIRGKAAEAERDRRCRELLPWAEAVLRQRLGADASEYAGLGLIEALKTYEPGRGVPLSQWMVRVLVWTAKSEIRKLDGRAGSRKREARAATHSLEDFDQASGTAEPHDGAAPDDNLLRAEETIAALRRIEEFEDVPRWVLLGRFLGGFTNEDLKLALGRRAGGGSGGGQIGRSLTDVRRSTPPR